MTQIKFSVKLFNTTDIAADGSNIPRRSCEEYLTSVNYSNSIKNKTAMGGLTHISRRLDQSQKGIIGMDDRTLLDDNVTHYITKLYFKDQADNFFYANAETFDPEYFAGKRAERIQNVIGQLASGVRMPISVVVQGLWSKRSVCEKLINIKGFDFTQNPSFKGAGMVGDIKTFSDIIQDNDYSITEEEIRQFSDANPDLGECKLQTRIYSSNGEVEVINEDLTIGKTIISFDKVFSNKSEITLDEVIGTYGLFSEQVSIAKQQSKESPLTKDLLSNVIKSKELQDKELELNDTDDVNLDYWANKFQEYTQDGDINKLQVLFRGNRDNIRKIVRSVPKDDPNHDKLILVRLNQFFRVNPQTSQFSTISSVSDRVRYSQLPRYEQINRVIKSYKSYWESKGNKLNESSKTQQKLLFLQDINLLLKNVYKELTQGKTINSLYGINRYGDQVRNSALVLSSTYRKLLISQNIMKFVPKALYGEWLVDLRSFYKALLTYTFNEPSDDTLLDMVDLIK